LTILILIDCGTISRAIMGPGFVFYHVHGNIADYLDELALFRVVWIVVGIDVALPATVTAVIAVNIWPARAGEG
jgi:hypothetical protein